LYFLCNIDVFGSKFFGKLEIWKALTSTYEAKNLALGLIFGKNGTKYGPNGCMLASRLEKS
jgi:hypothetical protein